jgi:uncharacterized protein (TIGR03000 family)
MAKLFVRIALGVALVVCVGSLRADGEKSDKGDKGDKKGAPTVKVTPTEKGRECKIHVYLPTPEAKLYFDETLMTKATGKERSFRSPALENGKRYCYKVIATWIENDREVTHETKIVFEAGEDVAVDFRR